MKCTPKVGVFDSGAGGLTVLAECVASLPQVKFYYYGDNGRAPYGSRSGEEITSFVQEALERFRSLGVDAAVLACNTATAVCIGEMRRRFSFPIVGTEPALRAAARSCGDVLVLATPRTAESARLKALIAANAPCRFRVYPCDRLAGAVEQMLIYGKGINLSAHLPAGDFDGVVLGCTHYSFLREEIAAYYGVPVFDGNEGIARRLKDILFGKKVEHGWSPNTKTNKSLHLKWSGDRQKQVVFLGKWGNLNEIIYKQTFKTRS